MINDRLESLGIVLPEPPAPAGAYVPAVRAANLLFISGQIPIRDGRVEYTGAVTKDTIAKGQESARLCVTNMLAHARRELGSLDRIARFVRLTGYVNAGPGFSMHPQVVNGASDMLYDIFGDIARHSRVAVGVSGLPLDAMTEIDAILEVS